MSDSNKFICYECGTDEGVICWKLGDANLAVPLCEACRAECDNVFSALKRRPAITTLSGTTMLTVVATCLVTNALIWTIVAFVSVCLK